MKNQNFIVLKDVGEAGIRFTNDIKLASALITCKFEVVQIKKQENPRNRKQEVLFGFEATGGLREAEMQYLSGNLMVDASSVLENKDKLLSYVSNGSRDVLESLYK
jgi:hypothetical protein